MANRDKWLQDNTHGNKIKFSRKKAYDDSEKKSFSSKNTRKNHPKKGEHNLYDQIASDPMLYDQTSNEY